MIVCFVSNPTLSKPSLSWSAPQDKDGYLIYNGVFHICQNQVLFWYSVFGTKDHKIVKFIVQF